jgi:tRNA A-37 threonylcarbamoyl transferase component Bud32
MRTDMSVRYTDVHTCISGSDWHGKILAGHSGIPELCMNLDSSGVALCKDRPKVKAGCCAGFFIKRYNMPGFFTQLRRRFKTPRPYRALAGALQLEKIGIATPEVIAALVETRNWVRREYLVTTSLSANSQTFLNAVSDGANADDLWQKLCCGVIPELCRLHDSGWIHGDLSIRNIYCDRDSGRYGFIDLDGMECCGRILPTADRCREIARLVSSYLIVFRAIEHRDEFICRAIESYRNSGGTSLKPDDVAAAMKSMIIRGEKYL